MSAEHVHALTTGARLNQYEMLQILGSGGFGITYMARDTTLDTMVAIKEYMPGELATRLGDSTVTARSSTSKGDFDWGLKRFLEEARVLAKFRHPNIVRVNQIFEANQTAYLVMEYAKGETLDAMLRRTGPISEQETKDILFPILDGLKRVHELGFLHRDIKPGNIIIRDEGGSVLIDFGAAREATGSITRAITSIVTEGYAPLEQYDATGNQGPWTDIYALGGVAYKCVTGNKPPSATSRVRTDPLVPLAITAQGRVSDDFASAVDMALRLHENERPQDIGQLLALFTGATIMRAAPPPADPTRVMQLDATRAMPSVSVKPVSEKVKPVTPAQPAAARSGRSAFLGAAAALLLVVAAGGWFYMQRMGPVAPATEVRVADAPVVPAPVPPSPPPSPAAPPVVAPPAANSPAAPPTAAASPAEQAPNRPNPSVAAGAPRPPAPPAVVATPKEPSGGPPPPPPAQQPQQRAAEPNPIPPLPATPARAITMLKGFSDPVLKAVLAQPGLRGRVETLMVLGGCDWRVNANVASQATTRQAGTYLNGMDDNELLAALSDGELLDRIGAVFGRGNCAVVPQAEGTANNGFPQPDATNRDAGVPNRNRVPGDIGQQPNDRVPVVPGSPYGGFGGYGLGRIP